MEVRHTPAFRWRIVLILCAAAFVLYIDRINITVAAPRLAAEFNLSHQSLGVVLGAFLFGYALGLAPGGWLADRFGPYKVLTAAGLCWAAITALTAAVRGGASPAGLPPSLFLIALRFALGLCESCAYPTFNRAVANWMRREERARAIGFINGSSALGGCFTPVFIALLIARFGWRESFLASSAITVGVTLWWMITATSDPSEHARVSRDELRLIISDKEELHAQSPDLDWYGRLARSQSAWMLCASEFFYGLALFVYITWFYTYFVEARRAGALDAAFLSSMPYLAMAIGAPLGGILCDSAMKRWGGPWGRRIVPLVSLLLSGLCAITAPALRNNAASAATFALAAGLQFVAAAAFWATVIDITRRGAGILGGLMNGSGSLGQAIGTVLFPRFVSYAGWEAALETAGACSLMSGLIWLLIDSTREIDRSSPLRAQSTAAEELV
jgi:MFS family permease